MALKAHPVTGLYPVKMLISEAGQGLRAGEIRGFTKEIAEALVKAEQAEAVDPVVDAPAKKSAPADVVTKA